jgi:hypothetical protein
MNRAKIAARVIAATSVLTVAASAGALTYRSVSGAQHAAAMTLPPDRPLPSPEPASLPVVGHYVGVSGASRPPSGQSSGSGARLALPRALSSTFPAGMIRSRLPSPTWPVSTARSS